MDVPQRHAGVGQGTIHDERESFDMRTRCDLRHDTAVRRMEFVLRSDDVRQDLATTADDRDGGLVARRLDAENDRVRLDHPDASFFLISASRAVYSFESTLSAHMILAY